MRELQRNTERYSIRQSIKKLLVVLPVIGFLFAFLAFTTPAAYAENEYSCGTYGAGNYGESCPTPPVDPTDPTDPGTGGNTDGGSSSGGTAGGTSSGSTGGSSGNASSGGSDNGSTSDGGTDGTDTSSGDGSIFLNNFSTYSSTEGKTLDLKLEQQVYVVVDGERHTITIKTITDEYIIVTIASTPTDVRVNKGETVEYDVDKDGTNDIALSYLTPTTSGASVNFAQLSSGADEQPEATGSSSESASMWWVWVLIAVAGLAIIITTAVVAAKRKKNA